MCCDTVILHCSSQLVNSFCNLSHACRAAGFHKQFGQAMGLLRLRELRSSLQPDSKLLANSTWKDNAELMLEACTALMDASQATGWSELGLAPVDDSVASMHKILQTTFTDIKPLSST